MEFQIRVAKRFFKLLVSRAPFLFIASLVYGVSLVAMFSGIADGTLRTIIEVVGFALISVIFATSITAIVNGRRPGVATLAFTCVTAAIRGLIVFLGFVAFLAPGIFLYVRTAPLLTHVLRGEPVKEGFKLTWNQTKHDGNAMTLSFIALLGVSMLLWIPGVFLMIIPVSIFYDGNVSYEVFLTWGIPFNFIMTFLAFTVWDVAWFQQLQTDDVSAVFE